MIKIICQFCSKEFRNFKSNNRIYCSRKCYTRTHRGKRHSPITEFQKGHKTWNKGKPHMRGENHPLWKGGRHPNTQGYIIVHKSDHPFCDAHGYIREHRLVMERMIKRYLKPKERVHHKGIKYPLGSIENKQDNRPENLQLFANDSEHNSKIPHKYKTFICKGRENAYWNEKLKERRNLNRLCQILYLNSISL